VSFVRRLVNVTFTLGQGAFGTDGSTSDKLSGLRTSVRINQAGFPGMGSLDLSIYGMTLSLMNKLSTLGMRAVLQKRNSVLVEAGDNVSGMSVVFIGTITNAYMDANAAPDVPFRVEAQSGIIEAVSTAPPQSFTGSTDVANVMNSLATLANLKFENNNVSVILNKPYFYGSPRQQMVQAAQQANINAIIDKNTLAIWPKNGARGGVVPLIGPNSGLIGYPTYTSNGLALNAVYNPSVSFGGTIQVQSSLTDAAGPWAVTGLDYALDSMLPKGEWSMAISATKPNLGPATA
jgi:hypothetical protein